MWTPDWGGIVVTRSAVVWLLAKTLSPGLSASFCEFAEIFVTLACSEAARLPFGVVSPFGSVSVEHGFPINRDVAALRREGNPRIRKRSA